MFWIVLSSVWSESLGKIGELLHVVTAWRELRSERARVAAEIVRAHRELWEQVGRLPASASALERRRDLARSPRTESETQVIRVILVHFAWAFGEHQSGRYALPQGLPEDIRDLFACPVVRDAWTELRRFHEPQLVSYVDRCLAAAF
jgi:hypothetical protein